MIRVQNQKAEVKLQSSNLTSAWYDEKGRTLEVEFHSSHRYRLHNVTPSEYTGLMNAPSPGTYYWARLRNKRMEEI